MPKQGEIVLIPIPFTDLSSQKRRPVILERSLQPAGARCGRGRDDFDPCAKCL